MNRSAALVAFVRGGVGHATRWQFESLALMKPEVLLIIVLGGGALVIVVINDWWKRRVVAKARVRGKGVRPSLLLNKTQWGFVTVVVVALALYAYLLCHPELTDRDFGRFNRIIHWFFEKRPSAS